MRILLVEDDRMIGEAVLAALREAGHAVDWTRNGTAALAHLREEGADLVVLDLGLAGTDGMGVLAALRESGDAVPVLVVTARDGIDDRVKGLDAGADDYLVKPFQTAELLARVRALARRKVGRSTPLLSNGSIALDPATREVSVDGGGVTLTAREFALLHSLLERPGSILSRRDLENRIYSSGEQVESNAVEFLIHSLRRKLGAEAVRNVRGMGWMVAKAS
jgi:two-component system OmpR family response regulator